MENKTISYLNSKAWYRFIKVIYIGIFSLTLIYASFILLNADYDWQTNISTPADFSGWIMTYGLIWIVFEAIRRVFYYVILGTFKPINSNISESDDEDILYDEARQLVIEHQKASASFFQRRLGVGYARAAHLMDELEEKGVIGKADEAKPREILQSK